MRKDAVTITKHEWDEFWGELSKDWYFDDSDAPARARARRV